MDNTNAMNTGVVTNGAENVQGFDNPLLNTNDSVQDVQSTVNQDTNNQDTQDLLNIFDSLPNGEIDNMLSLVGAEKEVFNGVNLSEYGDKVDFEDAEVRGILLENVNELKDKGLTPEQIQFVIGKQISMYESGMTDGAEEEELTPAEIKENLMKNLNSEERKNIPALLNWVDTAISSDILTREVKADLFTNPIGIKVLNALYKSLLSGGGNNIQEPKQTSIPNGNLRYSPEVAMSHYQDWLMTQPSFDRDKAKQQIATLRSRVSQEDLGYFDELFQVL